MFSYNYSDIPCIGSYSAAKKHYESIKPIRGTTTRPIGKRRATHRTIERVHNGYSASLYDNRVVTWLEDGRIVLDSCGYPTTSTSEFIRALIPRGTAAIVDKKLRYIVDSKSYLIGEGSEACVINLDGTVVSKPNIVHRLSRKRMNEVRKKYSEFITYVKTMQKVLPEVLDATALNSPVITTGGMKTKIGGCLEEKDLEAWGETLTAIYHITSIRKFTPGVGWTWCKGDIYSLVEDAIKTIHSDYLFEEVELPLGVYKKDTNAKYVY